MKKGTMFAIGGVVLSVLGAGLSFCKGRYDEKVADEKQTEKITKAVTEKITKAVADYMETNQKMLNSGNN